MSLLDISKLPDHACEAGLEAMYKAATSDGGGGDNGWPEHESPFIRWIIERFTERGLTQVEAVRQELNDWIEGQHHKPTKRQPVQPGQVERWTPEELKLVRLYLESLSPKDFGPEDWSMLVDYLAQRYLPREFALQAADWITAKSTVMGKVEALADGISDEDAERLAKVAPETPAAAEQIGLNNEQRAIMRFGTSRCGENITAITDAMRYRVKRVILDHQEAEFLGNKAATAESLETKLFDAFGTMNRDWRRIAMTEASENSNQGFIATVQDGKVKRLERYDGACAFCKRLNGREFKVVPPGKRFKDPETEVWVGKTNVGRSAAPMKRVAGELIARTPEEMWWPAAGVQHPHCRGRWLKVEETNTAGDDDFQAWMKAKLAATKPKRDDDEE